MWYATEWISRNSLNEFLCCRLSTLYDSHTTSSHTSFKIRKKIRIWNPHTVTPILYAYASATYEWNSRPFKNISAQTNAREKSKKSKNVRAKQKMYIGKRNTLFRQRHKPKLLTLCLLLKTVLLFCRVVICHRTHTRTLTLSRFTRQFSPHCCLTSVARRLDVRYIQNARAPVVPRLVSARLQHHQIHSHTHGWSGIIWFDTL